MSGGKVGLGAAGAGRNCAPLAELLAMMPTGFATAVGVVVAGGTAEVEAGVQAGANTTAGTAGSSGGGEGGGGGGGGGNGGGGIPPLDLRDQEG